MLRSSGTTACDTVGSNTGTYQGGFTLGQTGALNGDPDTAASFNGSNGLVNVPHSGSLDVADNFTLEAWAAHARSDGSRSVVRCGRCSELLRRGSGLASPKRFALRRAS